MRRCILQLLLTFFLALFVFQAKAHKLIKWDELCIPKDRISWMQPGGGPQQNGPLAEALNHLPASSQFSEPSVIVSFSGKEIAEAIQGYKGKFDLKYADGSIVHLNLGSVLSIAPVEYALQLNEGALIKNLRNIWDLSGRWAGSKITRLSGTPYYKAVAKPDIPYIRYAGPLTLLKIDPYNHGKYHIAFNPITNWYIGYCGSAGNTWSVISICQREMVGKRFYMDYSVSWVNINYIDQIDVFMESHIRKWTVNCGAAID